MNRILKLIDWFVSTPFWGKAALWFWTSLNQMYVEVMIRVKKEIWLDVLNLHSLSFYILNYLFFINIIYYFIIFQFKHVFI